MAVLASRLELCGQQGAEAWLTQGLSPHTLLLPPPKHGQGWVRMPPSDSSIQAAWALLQPFLPHPFPPHDLPC